MQTVGPLVVHVSDERTLVQLLSLAYPVGNLVLPGAINCFCIGHLPVKRVVLSVLLLAVGLATQIVLAFFYGRQSIVATFISDDWLSVGWLLTNLIFGIAGIWQATLGSSATHSIPLGSEEAAPTHLNSWVTYLPYASAIGAYVMLEVNSGNNPDQAWLAWTVGLIIWARAGTPDDDPARKQSTVYTGA